MNISRSFSSMDKLAYPYQTMQAERHWNTSCFYKGVGWGDFDFMGNCYPERDTGEHEIEPEVV